MFSSTRAEREIKFFYSSASAYRMQDYITTNNKNMQVRRNIRFVAGHFILHSPLDDMHTRCEWIRNKTEQKLYDRQQQLTNGHRDTLQAQKQSKKKSIYIFVAGAALRETIDLSCADRSGDNVRVEERRERKKEAHANHTSSPNLVRATAIKRSTLRLRPPFSCVKFSDDY